MGRLVGVFGCAGFAREVMALVHRQSCEDFHDDDCVFVIPDNSSIPRGLPIMRESDFLGSKRPRVFTIAIANGGIRERLHHLAVASGAEPLEVRSKSAEVFDDVVLGRGAVLCGHSSITSNACIGLSFHLNISSYLAHDCRVGNFVTLGPNVVCAGNVILEDCVYIGGGALIRQGTPDAPVTIGAGATIGMGAVVTKNVASGTVVVGNPARELIIGEKHD